MVASVRRPSRTLPTQESLNSQSVLSGERATEYAPSAPIQPSALWKSASSSGAGAADLTTGGSAPRAGAIRANQTMSHNRPTAASVGMQDHTSLFSASSSHDRTSGR